MTGFGFVPSGARGHALSEGMQQDLLGSLEYLGTCATQGELASLLSLAVARLSTQRLLSPVAFGLYFQVAESMLRGREDDAISAARQLVGLAHRRPGIEVLGRGLPVALELDGVLNARLGLEACDFAPVQQGEVDQFKPRLMAGMRLLEAGLPSLFSELQAILTQILVAKAPADARESFDGASHYQFWGLLLINPDFHPTRLAMAEVLAHESGHSILFGLTRNEPLVLNADEERYPSPLRTDERPMDGIFHATYVLARMAWAMESLAISGQLTPDERMEARHAAERDRDLFARGMDVVRKHAQLTDTGRQIIEGAQGWIEASRPTSIAVGV